ncbi:hypothetical protein BT63DRAFT_422651 [Microthyrium microscopicum]|uniref:Uncharacterized protein n=1 Tax=Microthyrium microscopicum TaxID=703497 RepID=A0A6A6UL07_9PEZI|nr:hypothetical protein BT63DRAFT_422651 [Microthyrium microscopicum]
MPGPAVQQRPRPGTSVVSRGGRTAVSTVSKRGGPNGLSRTAAAAKKTPPVPQQANGVSPFEIMAGRIANRVADMAENITFSEKPPPKQVEFETQQNGRKKVPRKLEIRLPNANANGVKFSAPFLDNLLGKMLSLQNRMLMTGSDLAASEADDSTKRDQFEQSAELSRIIALICAEKARQGVET